MKTTAVRLYGANDLRLETFELPEIKENEALLRIVTDSLCASTYKAVVQGTAHKRVPPDVAENPVLMGHEMCGEIVQVGAALTDRWSVGQCVVIQPALKLESGYDPGYSYPYIGGAATYVVVPEIVLERGCMIPYEGDSFFKGSLVEALGCGDIRVFIIPITAITCARTERKEAEVLPFWAERVRWESELLSWHVGMRVSPAWS